MSWTRRFVPLVVLCGLLVLAFWVASFISLQVAGWLVLVGAITSGVAAIRARRVGVRVLQIGSTCNALGLVLMIVLNNSGQTNHLPKVLIAVGLILIFYGIRLDGRDPAVR